jgi:TRAP-type C4-dicarboxylate transport system permease small subunit
MVKRIIAKPHLFFFAIVPLFILLSFIAGDKVIDINIFVTYYALEYHLLFLFSAVFFAMIGINYFSLSWSEKPPKKWITVIHLALQIIALILLFTNNNWNWISEKSFNGIETMNDNSNTIIMLSFLTFMLSVFFHLINFFTSLFTKKL